MALTKNAQGAACMTVAMAAFACSDSLSKILVGSMNVGQLLMMRGIGTTAVVLIIAYKLKAWPTVAVIRQPFILLRVACEATAALTYITALGLMPLANASAIQQAVPLVVTLGAALFLRERVGWRRWSAILIGLVGVLIIVRPGAQAFSSAMLLAVSSMIATAARDLATRRVDPRIPSIAVTACTGFFMTICGGLMTTPLGGWQAPTVNSLFLVALASLSVLVGYQTVIQAVRTGDISVVAPMRYLGLIFSALLGFFLFGERPDLWTIIGAVIVILSGLYTFHREARTGQAHKPRLVGPRIIR